MSLLVESRRKGRIGSGARTTAMGVSVSGSKRSLLEAGERRWGSNSSSSGAVLLRCAV